MSDVLVEILVGGEQSGGDNATGLNESELAEANMEPERSDDWVLESATHGQECPEVADHTRSATEFEHELVGIRETRSDRYDRILNKRVLNKERVKRVYNKRRECDRWRRVLGEQEPQVESVLPTESEQPCTTVQGETALNRPVRERRPPDRLNY